MSSQRSGRLHSEQLFSSASVVIASLLYLSCLWILFWLRVCQWLAANSYVRRLTGRKSTKPHRRQVTIDILPDDALLEIFHYYVYAEGWHTLVHVCRKWRIVVFGSPHHLGLRLYCNARTPVRKMLNIWPELPILVSTYGYKEWGMDNIFAALEHIDRICYLCLYIPSSQKVLEEMQQPFPALTDLYLWFYDETPLIVPASLLGGSAPLLQTLELKNISFPVLSKLLLSATHLVVLRLLEIPYSGHSSPEMMATCLSALTRLEKLEIGFKSPRSRPGQQSRHPPSRILLPFLIRLSFKGVCEYLEDFVARIDAPLLSSLEITFFHQLIFDTPRIAQFIYRAPEIKTQDGAHVEFSGRDVRVTLPQFPDTNPQTFGRISAFDLRILCSHSDWQLSSMAQVCSSSFPQALIHTVEDLYISEMEFSPEVRWQDDLESDQWLELLHPFTAVKDLRLSWDITRHIAPALEELVGERAMEVLPALQTLSINLPLPSSLVQESIEPFVAARELAGHPITIRQLLDENE